MPVLLARDFSLGWQPAVDQRNGPPSALLRMDNLVLDEQGIVALRQGSTVISGLNPLGGDISQMFTTTIEGVRYRYAQVGNGVFVSLSVGFYNQIMSNFPGVGDISFSAQLGQTFVARGSQKFKHDGDSTREWGITSPTATPNVSPTDPNTLNISTFNEDETPAWEAAEGLVDGDIGRDGLADGARVLTPDPTTGRGTMERVFPTETDFFNYSDGEEGAQEDLCEFYVWLSDPQNLDTLGLVFDVNGDDVTPAARFADDTYSHEFTIEDAVEVKFEDWVVLDDKYDVEGFDRSDVLDRRESRRVPYRTGRVRRDQPNQLVNSGWVKFSIPRNRFQRYGNTPGKSWETVKAVQFTVKYNVSDTVLPGFLKVDQLRFIGGVDHTLNGRYKVRCVLFADYGTHIVRSAPSEFSEEVELKANGLSVNFAIQSRFDQHVTGGLRDPTVGVEVYLMGGTLDGFYLAGSRMQTNGSVTINVTDSERTLQIRNTRLVTDNQPPPDDIISAIPHRQRMVVLTSTELRVSQLANPESFPVSLTFPVGNRSFVAYWMERVGDDLIVGTSIDCFVLTGIGEEYPDGTTDFKLQALGIAEPPISNAAASEGGRVVYLASDGPRLLTGIVGTSLRANLDILYQGVTRYTIAPPNLGSDPGRFRFAIWGPRLYAIVPEGSDTVGSRVLHVFDFRQERWYRRVYPRFFVSIYREPDGKIIAGDDSGSIYQLDVLTPTPVQFDETVSGGALNTLTIPYELWTTFNDDGKPFQRKDLFDVRIDARSTNPIDVQVLVDEATSQLYDSFAIPAVAPVPFHHVIDEGGEESPISVQLRLSGSSFQFRLRSIGLAYRDRPLPRLVWDTGFLDLRSEVPWIRRILVKMRAPADVVVAIIMDGVQMVSPLTITVTPDVETVYPVPVGRFCRGRQPRLVLQSTEPFELYWFEVSFHGTGQATEKKRFTIGDSTRPGAA